MRGATGGIILLITLASLSCSRDVGDVDTSRPAEFGFQTNLQTSLVEEGRSAYLRYCTGCHGDSGDGNGKAARFLHPRPRNFVVANFKFSSVRSGQLPSDADLRRTIVNGLKGSAMPPFELLPARTVDALITFIKTFSPKWKERPQVSPIPRVEDPYRRDQAKGIARGNVIYHGYAQCWNCHPAYADEASLNRYRGMVGSAPLTAFRANLDQAVGKPNAEGEVVYPPDFRRDFVRSGADIDSLYRSIAAGITGTAMPTWVDSMEIPGENPGDPPLVETEDLWAMAYYLQDLIKQRPKKFSEEQVVLRDRRHTIVRPGELPTPVTEATEVGTEDFEEAEEFEEEDE